MPPSTGDKRAHRQTDAVQSEMRRIRATDEPEEADPVDTVADEQEREREAVDEDAAAEDEDENED
jgi:hypothetical protein